ncbi:leucyl aminopeptidase [Sebaldella termitidis]|uniref:leucyl aminopeptidase n=1 Tax=Sebaldella termitidis TaxID=826 RepID=UPI003EC02013
MNISVINNFKDNFDTLILPVSKNRKINSHNKELDKKINKYIELYSFSYSDDKFLSFDLEADNKLKQIVLVNIDLPDKLQIRDTLFNVFGKISEKSKNILFINSDLFFDEYIITEIFILRYYKFIKYIEKSKKHKHHLFILTNKDIDLTETIELANSVNTARDLVNEPSNVLYPETLAESALSLGEKYGFEVEVLNKKDIKKLKMECFLKVGEGSDKEPKLIILRYHGNKKDKNKIGLIGKGVTFDSGGLSLKPSDSMIEMKSDMAGAAAVISAVCTASKMKIKKNIIGVIPACENMINGSSYKLGDIIKSMNGKTVEIHNTDAEGRLTIIDAVTYAIRHEKVTHILDIATLTGACMVALGTDITGVVTNDDNMLKVLKKASEISGELIWELPNHSTYKESLKSPNADLKNVGTRWGGAIIAGQFIEEFVEKLPWLHLDIAGPAFIESKSKFGSAGGTGAGTRLLYEFIKNF